jgi:hypothetical protein
MRKTVKSRERLIRTIGSEVEQFHFASVQRHAGSSKAFFETAITSGLTTRAQVIRF